MSPPSAATPWLALDTSGAQISLYLGPGGGPGGELCGLPAASLPSERLVACLAAMLRRQGLVPGDLAGLVVGLGPGSFTGLRVGLATAKGLCLGADLPIYGISSLALLAASSAQADAAPAAAASATAAPAAPDVLPAAAASAVAPAGDRQPQTLPNWRVVVCDARQEELYIGVYEVDSAGRAHPVLADVTLGPKLALAWLQEHAGGRDLICCGDASSAFAAAARAQGMQASAQPTQPSAQLAWAQASGSIARGAADDLFALVPRYLRLSAAERHLLPAGGG